jgi:hypothetical protein
VSELHVFGIRHHGPGSARSVLAGLGAVEPGCVLIEGPRDAGPVLGLAAEAGMRPPVALLGYAKDDPGRAVFWPFAVFSPEWQALRWALARGADVRFIDLPAGEVIAHGEGAGDGEERPAVVRDPLGLLAESAGYDDAERWWEDMVEHRGDDLAAFAAITEAMAALREQVGADVEDPHERRREDHMRAEARRALEDGFERVAVVCGAWHAPAFADVSRARRVTGVRGTPKAELTWVPWTYDRLAFRSGYGAGVVSPGWYEHLFVVDEEPVLRWLARVAAVLRRHDTDVSTAHVIEAGRTAQALAALRGRPLPGLPEIGDALRAVLGEGAEGLLALLQEELVIGQELGAVADAVPTVPLQRDLERRQRSLRLKPEAAHRDLDLDVRRPLDLERSHLLHRLALIGIPWGRPSRVTGARGTFREAWRLQWQPEFAVRIVEASGAGTTVEAAAAAHVAERAAGAPDLGALTELLEASLLADLPGAVRQVLDAFEARAARSTDVPALMGGLPALARAARYGTARATDVGALAGIVAELVVRIAVGLPQAAAGIDDAAAAALAELIDDVDAALGTLDDPGLVAPWRGALARAADRTDAHALVAGRCCRILRDAGVLSAGDAALRMDRALSPGTPALQAAAWIEGFLSGSGMAVIHDRELLGLLDRWLAAAREEDFTAFLAILRRTFATFTPPERRQIGARVRAAAAGTGAGAGAGASPDDDELDADRAALVLPVLRTLLGVAG